MMRSPITPRFYASLADFKKNPVLEQVFDAAKAQWVVENEMKAFRLLPASRQHIKTQAEDCSSLYVKGWSETIADLRDMLVRSRPTDDPRYRVHSVSYKQLGGKGRRYAREPGALSTTQREVRQLIAHPLLKDYDFTNAHPVILEWLCKREGIKCPRLTAYVKHRDAFLKKEFGDNPGRGKMVILSLINSENSKGTASYRGVDKATLKLYGATTDKKRLKK